MNAVSSFSQDHDFSPATQAGPDFTAIQQSPEFVALRRRLARFVLPMSVLFLTWYLTYVLLAAYAHDFMSARAFGNVTVGLLLGLSQFLSTVMIMLGYLRFAKRTLDPAVAELKARR